MPPIHDPARNRRQCPAARRSECTRHADLPPHRCRPGRDGRTRPRTPPGGGRRTGPRHLLRRPGGRQPLDLPRLRAGRVGCHRIPRRSRCSIARDLEHREHSDRGDRARLPDPRTRLRAAGRQRGRRDLSRRPGGRARVRGAVRRDHRQLPSRAAGLSPKGTHGAGAGSPSRCRLLRPGGDWEELPPKGSASVSAGYRLRVELPGGAGFGRPEGRTAAAVAADLASGLLSAERARLEYGG